MCGEGWGWMYWFKRPGLFLKDDLLLLLLPLPPPWTLQQSLVAHIHPGRRRWAQSVFFSGEREQTIPHFPASKGSLRWRTRVVQCFMMLVGKPQQVSRSHSNTTSLMHAGPVQTTEWSPLHQQRANTNNHQQPTCCLSELALCNECRCAKYSPPPVSSH